MLGDTIVLDFKQHDPAQPGVQNAKVLRYNFVIGKYAGLPVLWRGAGAAKRAEAYPHEMSEYLALFYSGPDPARPQVPSCGDIRRRLAQG
jgi:hypothetical protein